MKNYLDKFVAVLVLFLVIWFFVIPVYKSININKNSDEVIELKQQIQYMNDELNNQYDEIRMLRRDVESLENRLSQIGTIRKL